MLHQLSTISRGADGGDRPECGFRKCHKISVLSHELHPESGMSGSGPQAIRLHVSREKFRICGVVVATPNEPEADDPSPKFGDRPGERAVSRYPLLAQPFVAREPFGPHCVRTLKHEGDDRSEESACHSDHAGQPSCHAYIVCRRTEPSGTDQEPPTGRPVARGGVPSRATTCASSASHCARECGGGTSHPANPAGAEHSSRSLRSSSAASTTGSGDTASPMLRPSTAAPSTVIVLMADE